MLPKYFTWIFNVFFFISHESRDFHGFYCIVYNIMVLTLTKMEARLLSWLNRFKEVP